MLHGGFVPIVLTKVKEHFNFFFIIDFNKIKLVFNHRNRRNVNEFTRLKRATNPQKKRKKKSYSITFTFTVKGIIYFMQFLLQSFIYISCISGSE